MRATARGCSRKTATIAAVVVVLLFTAIFPTGAAGQLRAVPARPDLPAVPLPPVDSLEPAVREQIEGLVSGLSTLRTGEEGRRAADAYGELGRVLHAHEFLEGAEAAYRNAMRLARSDPRWPHLLGYLLAQTGRLEEAVEQFAETRRLQPSNQEALAHTADALLRLNRPGEAGELFAALADVYPAFANHGLGEVALRAGRYREAVDRFTEVLKRMPDATGVHYSMAMAYRGLGRIEDARRHLELRGAGQVRVADPLVDDLRTLVRGEHVLLLQGQQLLEAGQAAEAADVFRRAVEAEPRSAAARVNLGLALARLGERVAAVEALREGVALDPANVAGRASLGAMLAEDGQLPEAAEHLGAAVAGEPDAPATRTLLLRTLLRLGRTDEAIATLERAVSHAPGDEGAAVELAILLADRARYADAIARLEAAHAQMPGSVGVSTTLARLLAASPDRSLRNGERALTLATDVYESTPSPAGAETVALSLAELGRCTEARTWIERGIAAARGANDDGEAVRLEGWLTPFTGADCRP